ncbi:MAG: MarR family transcriptional regulator [Methanomicrobiales archaeon]|jgi:DNA-binding MarR family transcriptional regulator|nr:MarR family transcriptional regulator [Methanomicrobiales archaeon]
MRREHALFSMAEGTGSISHRHVTIMHGWIIAYLYHNHDHDIFQRDIETIFSIRRSTATDILQRMEKSDLITREQVTYDKRLKKIMLTQKSIEIHDTFAKKCDLLETKLTKGIEQDELDAFFSIIEKMEQNIEKSDSVVTSQEEVSGLS